jgi:kynureninase
MSFTLEDARALDAADPLRAFRDRFILPEGVIYLDGNSLGPLPAAAARVAEDVVRRQWGEGLIRSWNDEDWIGAPARLGDKIAALIGAAPGEVVATDSTSVNIFKLLIGALGARPGRKVILTETGNFPTDLYMAQGIGAALAGVEVRAVAPEVVEDAISDDVAVVMLTHVHYKTAARRDMAAVTARAQAAGALILWDLSHSVGAIAVDLNGCGVDLAVGCGYKFLNGGPGAPAFLFVAKRLYGALSSPLTGWMGHAAPFAFVDDYAPAPGIERFLCGTPPLISLLTLEAGLDIALEADLSALQAKSAALWRLFDARMAERFPSGDFIQITPADPARRGSHIAYAHPEGYAIMQALIERGVIGDFRDPDVIRFGLTPLYLGYEGVWRAVEILAEVMASEAWRRARPRGRVT